MVDFVVNVMKSTTVAVLNPLFLSSCNIGKNEAEKFERVRGLKALVSVNRVLWYRCVQLFQFN